jgi:hypothetical protein
VTGHAEKADKLLIKPTAGARPASPCSLGRFIRRARRHGLTPDESRTTRRHQPGNNPERTDQPSLTDARRSTLLKRGPLPTDALAVTKTEALARKDWRAQVYLLMRAAEWLFFLNVAVLLVPNELVRGVVATITAPVIFAAGVVLLVNWRGAIQEFRAELEVRNFGLARATSAWPNYPWRALGGSIVMIGVTVLAVGIVALAE